MDDLDEPTKRLVDAANAGDTEGFLAGFTETGVVDDWGREFRGAAKIRGWSDREFIGKQVSLDVDTVRRRGNETVITVTVGGNGYNGPGHFTFKSDGNRISRMMIRA